MADILSRYGIKEVADVTFYTINPSTGEPDVPVLYLDTLKVSTTEQAANAVDATGGKGNAVLITWDTSRDITVNIEDALFSVKSLAMTYGASIKDLAANGTSNGEKTTLVKSVMYTATGTEGGEHVTWTDVNGDAHEATNPEFYDPATDAKVTKPEKGKTYLAKFTIPVAGQVFSVTSTKFPGTYYVTGDTYARRQIDGVDEYCQLIFPKAKITSDGATITMEADGDPATFQMNLRLMRGEGNVLFKLVKYDLTA